VASRAGPQDRGVDTEPIPAPGTAGVLPPPDDRWPLRRARSGRVLAGVAAGFARYCGIDPVLVRVALVVLTLFGGTGVLLYVLGWLLLPEEGDDASVAEALIGRGRSSVPAATGVLLLALAVLVLAVGADRGPPTFPLLVLAGIAVALLVRHGARRPPVPPPFARPPSSLLRLGDVPAAPASDADRTRVAELLQAAAGAGLLDITAADDRLAWVYAATTRGELAAVVAEFPPEWVYGWESPAAMALTPPAVRTARRRSALGRLVLSLAVLAVGLAIGLDRATGVDLTVGNLLALALGVLGAGLVVGAWLGRARWLIALGIPLSLAVLLTSAVPVDLHGGTGERRWRPVPVGGPGQEYRLGAGDATLDLTAVDDADGALLGTRGGRRVTIRAGLGLGRLSVLVPDNLDVEFDARVGLGQLLAPGVAVDGVRVRRRFVVAALGSSAGRVFVDAELGVGELEVLRAA
jgi:phage shock protein PspC (stress-responsive transcriptional regulator)